MFSTLFCMVFCRSCQKKVADCEHHVYPLETTRISVFDAKVETLAYDEPKRTLEIAFKNGQTRQLFDLPPDVFNALQDSTISSFLKFIAHRYKSAPVKTGQAAVRVPESEACPKCKRPMTVRHRTGSDFEKYVRVLWECGCGASEWKQYGLGLMRERRGRWR